jgi:uncharacterized OB-fold protein
VVKALPPKPVADHDTQPFWDGVSERRLLVQRCSSCQSWIWQPRPICPRCHAAEPVWTEVTGKGRVASWTVIHPPVLEVWADAVPFVVLLVELDEGVRMLGQLVDENGTLLHTDGTNEALAMGRKVSLMWRIDESGGPLPAYRLV